jgi:hypothetical protein
MKIAFYYGSRTNTSIFQKVEKCFLKMRSEFEIHHSIIIANSLVSLDQGSEKFCSKLNEELDSMDKEEVDALTELLTFQLLNIISKRNEFTDEVLIKILNHYQELMMSGEVRPKQAFALIRILNTRINKTSNSATKEVISSHIENFKKFGDSNKNKHF